MPVENEIKEEYGRIYRWIKPNATDPGTWRLSVPETGIGSPGGGGTTLNLQGELPIKTASTGTAFVISFDIEELTPRVSSERARSMAITLGNEAGAAAIDYINGVDPIEAETIGSTTVVSFNLANLESRVS